MTGTELDAAKRAARNENNPMRRKELMCIDMINSIIAYGGYGKTAKEILEQQERSYHNYLADYMSILGEEHVIALIEAQLEDIVGVRCGVFTDSDGLPYNSIVWAR